MQEKDMLKELDDDKELRCYNCGYRGKTYLFGNDFSQDEGAGRMCPQCRSFRFEIVSANDSYDVVAGWKRTAR